MRDTLRRAYRRGDADADAGPSKDIEGPCVTVPRQDRRFSVLFVEPEPTGHHMALYMRLLVRHARIRGWRVRILTTPRAAADPAFELVRKEADPGSFHVSLMDDVPKPSGSIASLVRYQYLNCKAIRQAVAALSADDRPDAAFVINCDYFDKVAAILGSPFGSIPFAGILMGPGFHRQAMGLGPARRLDRVYEWLFRRFLRLPGLIRAVVIDEALIRYADAHIREADRMRFVPDVGEVRGEETRDEARTALGIGPDQFAVLLYGQITRRKGLVELLSALERGDPRLTALVVGRPDDTSEEVLRSPSAEALRRRGALITSFGFQSDAEEYRAFQAADAVWLGYVHGFYGSSGVLLQAASVGVPVVASEEGLVGWITRTHKIGVTVSPGDEASVAAGLRSLVDDPGLRQTIAANSAALAERHRGVNFSEAILGLLETSSPSSAPR